MEKKEEPTTKEAAKEFLESLVSLRNAPLLLLGATTLALVYPTSVEWAHENLGYGLLAQIVANIVTLLVYMMFDGLLEITLSYTDNTEYKPEIRWFYVFVLCVGGVALAGSGTLSIWSAPIVVALTDNTSEIGKDTKDLARMKLKNDSLAIIAETEKVSIATSTYNQRITAARQDSARMEKEAAQTSHNSWYRDYKSARTKSRHWFWDCDGGQGCPKAYRDYRDGIKEARNKGAALVAREAGLSSSLASNGSSDEFIIEAIQMAAVTDSVMLARNLAMFEVKRKALVSVELFSALAVILLTITIMWGKKQHGVTLSREFVTLFGVVRQTLGKVITTFLAIYQELIAAINPATIQNLVMAPVELIGNTVGRKARLARQRIEEAEKQNKALEQKREEARQEAERARKEAQAARDALEREKNARIEREKALEREKQAREERERILAIERQRREEAEARARAEREREALERAQNKAREANTLVPVDKATKDRILNAIRYQLKTLQTLDATKDATNYSAVKLKINEIIADRQNGLAFLESRGYNCSVDWKTGSVSAKLPKGTNK